VASVSVGKGVLTWSSLTSLSLEDLDVFLPLLPRLLDDFLDTLFDDEK